MWEQFLDVVLPRTCLSCGKFGSFFCQSCLTRVTLYQQSECPYCKKVAPQGLTHKLCKKECNLDGLFVWAKYSGPIPKVIKAIKYEGVYGALGEVALLMVESYGNQFEFDYLVPIPLSKKRERERGFNQAEKLAQKIRSEINRKYLGKDHPVIALITREKDTKPQFDLGIEERKTNLKNAFVLSSKVATLSGLSFCLVDDVATTGTTLFECAKVLKRAGARKVYAVAIARG